MGYSFRNTYKESPDSYVEDRGFPYFISRGNTEFSIVDAEFGALLSVGQTAVRDFGVSTWTVVDGCPFIEEDLLHKFASLRKIRDAKLAATDYIFMPDYPISESELQEYAAYRQALRDLPSFTGAPWDGGYDATPWPVLNK